MKLKPLFYWTFLFFLCSCTTVADFAGYDTQSINQKAAQSYQAFLSDAYQQGALDNSSATARSVHQVFSRLLPAANMNNQTGRPFDWQMNVIRSKELNAWAMPGGKMVVYSGLVENLHLTDDELAAVIGHEMTHAIREHSKAQIGQQLLTGIGMQIGGNILANQTNIDPQMLNVGQSLLSEYGIDKPFSRQHETEADIGGLMMMAAAGYNPQAALSVWQKMGQAGGGSIPTFLSTHPSGSERIAVLQQYMPQAMAIYQQSRRAF
ncbi:MAG: M48 family metallopeptidase [Cardiobacteriaceae bacterium]|nr:M48 family metallopeptidase [Cardiobacteriaceae bacterium]